MKARRGGPFFLPRVNCYEATAACARILETTETPLFLSNRRLIDCEHGPQSQKCSSFSIGLRAPTRNGLLLPFELLGSFWDTSGRGTSTSTRKIFPSRK